MCKKYMAVAKSNVMNRKIIIKLEGRCKRVQKENKVRKKVLMKKITALMSDLSSAVWICVVSPAHSRK